jgi:hypothetical protein
MTGTRRPAGLASSRTSGLKTSKGEEAVRRQVTPDGGQRRQQVLRREQVQERVPGHEDQIELAVEREIAHVALEKRHRRSGRGRARPRDLQHGS